MLDKFAMIGLMACLHATAMLINYYCQYLEETNEHNGLQMFLCFICAILHFFSLPVFVVSYGIQYLYQQRSEKRHNAKSSEKLLEQYIQHRNEIASLEKELEYYRRLSSSERKDGYASGLRAGFIDGFMEGFEFGFTYDELPPELKTSPGLDVKKQAVYVYEHDIKPQLNQRQK